MEEDKPLQPFKDGSGFYTTSQRSRTMSRIRGKHTKPEMKLRKALWQKGFRYRINAKHLPGKPDIAIQKYRLAIFVDGEFWHGHDWENRKKQIKTNRGYWIPKIKRNMARDTANNRALEAAGWTVLRFWAKEVDKHLDYCVQQVLTHLGYYEPLNKP